MYKYKPGESALNKPFIGMIEDFETFLDKLEKRREQLDDIRDDLLIYKDPVFLESIRRADADAREGRMKHCSNAAEIKRLFRSL